jgi:hypothetical protein
LLLHENDKGGSRPKFLNVLRFVNNYHLCFTAHKKQVLKLMYGLEIGDVDKNLFDTCCTTNRWACSVTLLTVRQPGQVTTMAATPPFPHRRD